MVSIVSVLGSIFGLAGVLIAIYSYQQQKKFKSKMEEQKEKFDERISQKEEMAELADILSDIRKGLEATVSRYSDPLSDQDTRNALRHLAYGVLEVDHAKDSNPKVKISQINYRENEDLIQISDPSQVPELIKDDETIYISTTIESKDGEYQFPYNYDVDEGRFLIGIVYSDISKAREHSGTAIHDIDPGLLDSLESGTDNLVEEIYSNMIDSQEGFEIDPDQYEDAEEIALAIREKTIGIESLNEEVEELSTLAERVRETRRALVEAHYS